ncbi:hypothetical protein [Nostoc sp. DSM 114161]
MPLLEDKLRDRHQYSKCILRLSLAAWQENYKGIDAAWLRI